MLSNRAANITPSATHAMNARLMQRRAAGADIIAFNVGEPDFATPKPIVDACIRALLGGLQ